MTATKIIAFLIIITLAGTGYYFYQDKKQKESLVTHNKTKYEQLKKAAQKSGSAGFLVMASAINKFHQVKGHYPEKLIELYPDFIPDQPFIEQLNWDYKSGEKNYVLKRSMKGKPIYTMGPDLKLTKKIKEKVFAPENIASVELPNSKASQDSSKTLAIKPDNNKRTDHTPIANVSSSQTITKDTQTKPGAIKKTYKAKPSKRTPGFIIIKKELSEKEKFLASFSGNKYYIWKTSQGVIGFSNIQYPDEKNLTIYKNNNWIQYQYK